MAPVVYEGLEYPSSEHAFQAAKSLSGAVRKVISKLSTPGKAKRAGRKVTLRPDWNIVKVQIMEEIVRDKFTRNEELGKALLETEDQELVEGNTWGDIFWGVALATDIGQNNLGKILMRVRDEIRNQS